MGHPGESVLVPVPLAVCSGGEVVNDFTVGESFLPASFAVELVESRG